MGVVGDPPPLNWSIGTMFRVIATPQLLLSRHLKTLNPRTILSVYDKLPDTTLIKVSTMFAIRQDRAPY